MTTPDSSPFPLLLRRIFNRMGKPFGINPFPRAFNYALGTENTAESFEQIYQNNFWGSATSRSGVGSELAATAGYRAALTALIQQRGFTSLFDAPCGDLHWMPHLLATLPQLAYHGGDISASLVADLQQRHPDLSLRTFDICVDAFPKVDVWHCRDCLFHLPLAQIRTALGNFVASEIPYALLTTHRALWLHHNLDLQGVGFRFLDLERAPFSFPTPIAYLPDYRRGWDFPRYVGLWSRAMIQEALARP